MSRRGGGGCSWSGDRNHIQSDVTHFVKRKLIFHSALINIYTYVNRQVYVNEVWKEKFCKHVSLSQVKNIQDASKPEMSLK